MQAQQQPANEARRHWMSVLAKADSQHLQHQWASLALAPDYRFIRPPEVGTSMVRGRIGGSGQPFNLGEMTVIRCAVKLASGTLGFSYIAGRDQQHATIAALADALLQESGGSSALMQQLIEPLAQRHAAAKAERANRVSQTRVDFFTLVRGEDR